jgi:CheY-like chemotaxis protein
MIEMAKKVILVDDDLEDCELFLTFFANRSDIDILPPLLNGVELIDYLAKINSDDDLPNLIILDQNMPKMNGKQTLAFLKSEKRYAKISAVIYSTYTDSALVADCKKLGAAIVATKPIDNDGYQKMMDDFLRNL